MIRVATVALAIALIASPVSAQQSPSPDVIGLPYENYLAVVQAIQSQDEKLQEQLLLMDDGVPSNDEIALTEIARIANENQNLLVTIPVHRCFAAMWSWAFLASDYLWRSASAMLNGDSKTAIELLGFAGNLNKAAIGEMIPSGVACRNS